MAKQEQKSTAAVAGVAPSTVASTPSTPVTTVVAVSTKAPKSYSTKLNSPDGKQAVIAQAVAIKTGFRCSVGTYSVGEKSKLALLQRGASKEVTSLSSAKAYVADASKALKALGWVEAERKGPGGFTPKPDAFSLANLPKPNSK